MHSYILSPDDEQNVNCLSSIINGTQKSETWLVFMVHGFTGSLDDSPFLNWTRDSTLARYLFVMSYQIFHNWQNITDMYRYTSSDRRVIGATVGYGAVSSKSQTKDLDCLLSFVGSFFGSNYIKASTTSMVMGHLLARLAETIQGSLSGTLKTFCIGISLGAQLCGFAGKDYRHECYDLMKNLVHNIS